jgi:hypothetical protein
MNKTVYRMFIFHLIGCIILGLAAFSWNDNEGLFRPYLELSSVDIVEELQLEDVLYQKAGVKKINIKKRS